MTAIRDLLADARRALPAEGKGARFRAHLQEFSVKAGPVGVGIKIEHSNDTTAYGQLLELLTSLGKLAKTDHVGVALIIDEAQVMPSQDLHLLFRVVNYLDELPITVMMAGLPNIPDISGEARSPTVPHVWYEDLDSLGPQDARSALISPAADCRGEFDPEAVSMLVKFAQGHPLVLQILGSSAWIEADRDMPSDDILHIERRHAVAAINSTISQLNVSVYRPVWISCNEAERKLLATLAASRYEMLERNDLIGLNRTSRISEQIHTNVRAFDALVGTGILYTKPVRFVVPGFGDFIRNQPSHT